MRSDLALVLLVSLANVVVLEMLHQLGAEAAPELAALPLAVVSLNARKGQKRATVRKRRRERKKKRRDSHKVVMLVIEVLLQLIVLLPGATAGAAFPLQKRERVG